MDERLPDTPRKGRGAVGNPTGRFEREIRHAVDDGWGLAEDDVAPLRTTVTDEKPRAIISRNASPDIFFNQSINPYRGCEHGCIYCFARPTHAFMGLSPGLDFETRLFAKPDAALLLEKELSKPGYVAEPFMLGANTDPYQPIERDREITRSILEVLARFRHPVMITTKSALITRDLDILAPMAADRLVGVGISLTTLDKTLARRMEPRAAAPHRRLETIAALSTAGIPVTVLVSPVIPFLTESEIERILKEAAAAGARAAGYILLRLPLELKELFTEWLENHFPGSARHVLNRLRESRDGQLYVAEFGARMRGHGAFADLIEQRFRLACRKHGLASGHDRTMTLDAARFRVPPRPGDQLQLL
ncbi:MAG: PA0069 family radical SAM protein [Rhodospirillales bacterium]|nr:PA0069 family radical SAM protein [Rhodospirillales bacterium]